MAENRSEREFSDWLAHRAQVSPEATALVEAEDGTTWTYRELDSAVDETAGRLAALGVRAGDHLGVVMETRPAFVRLVHAVARLGAVLVPLNARLARPELVRQAEVGDVTLLVCERETEADSMAISAESGIPVASVDSAEQGEVAALREQSPTEFESGSWSRADTQALLFTSGTTGDPKAVALSMGNFLSSAMASAFRLGVTPDDRWLLCLSMYHMGGLSVVLRSALYGTTVVLQEGFDAERAVEAIEEYDVTGVSLVPTMLRRMLDSAGDESEEGKSGTEGGKATDEDGLADSLRFVLLGGAPAPEELVERCQRLGVPVHPTYGMTETASQIATARPGEAFEHRGTVGRPLLFTDLTVVGEDDEPLEPGDVGELVVSGPTVAQGYYGDSTATDEAFCEYGLRTGDVGYRDEAGRVWVLNRREDRIITGGENVHPGEVVAVLRDHPDVRDAVVVGLSDSEWGERVGALVVAEGVGEAEVEAHCRERLAGYKCPRTIAFADELPRTASGTVERETVRERLRE